MLRPRGSKDPRVPSTACVNPDPAWPSPLLSPEAPSSPLLPSYLPSGPLTVPLPRSETLPVEHMWGKPLCMNQYYQILSSCRVPGPKQDSVVNFKTKKSPTHITVVHNYQVGGPHTSPPRCCRGWGAGPKVHFPNTYARVPPGTGTPWTSPRGAQLGPGLSEATRGRGPARPGESDTKTSFPVSHPWPDPVPSTGPGTALAVTSGSPGPEETGVGGDCCQSETATSPLLSPPASARGQFFELDVYHSDGTPLTSDQIFVQLEKIWNSSLQTNKEPVGILTSNHRNSWAKAYSTLIKGAGFGGKGRGTARLCLHQVLSPPVVVAPGPGHTAPLSKVPPGVGGHIPTSVHTRPWARFRFSLNPLDSGQVSLVPFHR